MEDRWGNTALNTALNNGEGWNDVTSVLLQTQYGADIEHRDLDGLTPLMQAAISDNIPMITLLLNKGADVNAVYKGHGWCESFKAADFAQGKIKKYIEEFE